jgi:hypothetical protein
MSRTRGRVARSVLFLSVAALAVTALVTSAGAADRPVVTEATLSNGQPLPKLATLPQYFEGGFSGLYPVAGEPNHYWTISDRGPNGDTFTIAGVLRRAFASPQFTPRIYKVAVDPSTGDMQIIDRILLHLPAGQDDPARVGVGGVGGNTNEITGFGNTLVNAAANVPVPDESPTTDTDGDGDIDGSDALLPLDPYGLDTEGVVAMADGTFWLVDEYRPSIIHVSADGELLRRITPAGQNATNLPQHSAVPLSDILPANYSLRRDNRGFEGVAVSPDGKTLYAIMQNPLAIPTSGTNCTGVSGTVGNNSRSATRIAKLNITNPAAPTFVGDFFYTLQTDGSGVTLTDLRISDLYYVGPDKLLVDERDDAAGGPNKWLYEVDVSAATNLQTLDSTSPTSGKCIDALKPADVAARKDVNGNNVVVGTKTLRLTPGANTASPAYPFSKLEGITPIGTQNFATVNDNDFNLTFTGDPDASTPSPMILGVGDTETLFIEYGPPRITELSDVHAWVGLKNSDDQGTKFDVKVDLLKNGTPVASGLTRCVAGVTRNPNLATEVVVPWDPTTFAPDAQLPGDVLTLQVSTRIGTDPDNTRCTGPGGSHNNAVGLRLYYDAASRASRFDATLSPNANADWYLRSDGKPCANVESAGVTNRRLDTAGPTDPVAKCKDSAAVNFSGGNPFKVIGSWSVTPLT